MGNAINALNTAFGDDVIDELIDNGASGAGLLGSETAATFNLEAGLSKWRSTLSASIRNHILVFGDSNAAGTETYRWPNALKAALVTQTGRPDGGPGFRHFGLPEWAMGGWLQFSGGPNNLAPNGQTWWKDFGATNPATWTLPASLTAHDRFVIYGVDPATTGINDIQYSLNGGAFAATAFNFTGTTYSLVTFPVTGAITTTLRLQGVNIFAPSFGAGVAFYNGDGTNGPLVVHNLATGGNDTDIIAGSTQIQADPYPPGPYKQPDGFENRLALVDNLQPKLSIVYAGGREFLNYYQAALIGTKFQMPLERYEANLRRIVGRCRTYGDVLVIAPHALKVPDPFTSAPLNIAQRDYAERARKVAYDNDCAFINMNALWGTYDRMNARGFMLDALHITQFGHERMTNFLSRTFSRIG